MNDYITQFIPIMEEKDNALYGDILTGVTANPLIDKIKAETGVDDIITVPYIQPWVLHSIDTPKGKWKLRQPLFEDKYDGQDFAEHVHEKLGELMHPYYKRVCIIDAKKGIVTKFYSTEARKNYAHIFQGSHWGDSIKQINKHTSCIPKLLHWFPEWRDNINVAVFEYVEGKSLQELYSIPGKHYDRGHPDVVAGRLPSFWGKIDSVNFKNIIKVKNIVESLFIELYRCSQEVDFTSMTYQELDNEPEWLEIWKIPGTERMWNPDDWSLENIVETPAGDYKMIKLDRSVVTDPDNAVERFIADFRNQTNITWESSSQIISKLK